jgi:GH18 family chitinase
VLKQFDNDNISNFLNNQPAQDNFLKSVDSILLAYPITGINLDIEYCGENSQTLRPNLVQFVKKLNAHLDQKYNNINLSIDVYASAASNPQSLWDLNALKTEVDYIIVMAYDFHQRSSTQAGPVAPLFSENGQWNKDFNQHLKIFFEQVPREKILLGIPFMAMVGALILNKPKLILMKILGLRSVTKNPKNYLLWLKAKLAKNQLGKERIKSKNHLMKTLCHHI